MSHDELAVRRMVKLYGTEEPRLGVAAYGEDGYAIIDLPIGVARELQVAIDESLGRAAGGDIHTSYLVDGKEWRVLVEVDGQAVATSHKTLEAATAWASSEVLTLAGEAGKPRV